MAITAKLGVEYAGFVSGMQKAQQSVKTTESSLKKIEAEFKATGNAEQYMTQKADVLNQKLQSQKKVADNAKNALAEMNKQGIDPASKEYQKLAQQLLNAEAAMYETQAALNGLDASALKAADSANELVTSVNGMSKKISLEQVIGGINSITSGLESGAKKAKELGEALWNDIMDSARWADDTATMAMMYGIDIDTYQRMQKLVQNGMDTTVDAILGAQTKLKKGIGSESSTVLDYLKELHIVMTGQGKYGEQMTLITQDETELFWETGQALMAMSSAYDKEAAAQALFGKSWKELIPLFSKYKSLEEYNAALAEVNVNTEEDVERLAELNDRVSELQGDFQTLKNEVLAELAPALTGAAEALDGLLERLMEYLQTDEGQQMLERLGTAVSGLFDDLGKIDPEAVVSGFVSVFETVIGSLEWLVEHQEDVINAMKAIVIGWGTLKLTGGALQILKLIDGIKGLTGGKNAGDTATQTAITGGGGITAWLAKTFPTMAKTAGNLAAFDPTGLTALIQSVLSDQTTLGRWLRNGAGLGDALTASWGTVKASANEGINNFTKYFTEQLPNAFWGALGITEQDFVNFFTRRDQNADAATRLPTGADWRLEYQKGTGGNYYNPNMPIIVEPEVAEGAAEEISEDIGVVPVMVEPVLHKDRRQNQGIDITDFWDGSHANGLWSVPYDGYLARLHRGERVIPAREVSSRNFSSNLYVESMYMNNGADANGLAAAMAAAQKRAMAGYGS